MTDFSKSLYTKLFHSSVRNELSKNYQCLFMHFFFRNSGKFNGYPIHCSKCHSDSYVFFSTLSLNLGRQSIWGHCQYSIEVTGKFGSHYFLNWLLSSNFSVIRFKMHSDDLKTKSEKVNWEVRRLLMTAYSKNSG